MIKDTDYIHYQRKMKIEFLLAITLTILCFLMHVSLPFDFIVSPTLAGILMTIVFGVQNTFSKNTHVERHRREVDEFKKALKSLKTDGLIESIKYENDNFAVKLSEEKVGSILEKHQQIRIH